MLHRTLFAAEEIVGEENGLGSGQEIHRELLFGFLCVKGGGRATGAMQTDTVTEG